MTTSLTATTTVTISNTYKETLDHSTPAGGPKITASQAYTNGSGNISNYG